jgi:acetate kinase
MHCEPAAIEEMLNRHSGLRGLCDSNDMREVLARAAAGDARADLALAVYCRRVKKYVGAYFALLGRLDAVVFTAGVGENAPAVRARVCAGLEGLGIVLDPHRNENARGDVSELQVEGSAVRVLVVRTDEELEIAEQTCALLASEPS